MVPLFHGGPPGLRIGDLIAPVHQVYDNCHWCAGQVDAHRGSGGPARHADRVYVTPNRLYAQHFAELWGAGDLYRSDPIGECERSTMDSIVTFHVPTARVVEVMDRGAPLTTTQRWTLFLAWAAADVHAATGAAIRCCVGCDVPIVPGREYFTDDGTGPFHAPCRHRHQEALNPLHRRWFRFPRGRRSACP